MANILAVESAGVNCSVALNIDGRIHQLIETSPRQHARKILPMVNQLFAEAEFCLSDLNAIAFAHGPGSFTGLRIGFGVVQGLAFGNNLPVIGISTLEAMAARVVKTRQLHSGNVVPVLDARMSEVFMAIYQVSDHGELKALLPDCAKFPESALEFIVDPVAAAVGDGWRMLESCKAEIGYKDLELGADAYTVSMLGASRFSRGECVAIDEAELVYIRNEVSWKKRQRLRVAEGSDRFR